ncbi:hypothetical protein GOZ84_05070 [Agrobacterium vitis]|uniref:hypothetical protein n=1 Tax=Agrobacterium vitis TaxID=373 RepID=UPI0012E91E43|nr:hypothetical protein [Agrobacterium vitis]MVA50161.1 hypothetical protein [Agrobacterium vitis]
MTKISPFSFSGAGAFLFLMICFQLFAFHQACLIFCAKPLFKGQNRLPISALTN